MNNSRVQFDKNAFFFPFGFYENSKITLYNLSLASPKDLQIQNLDSCWFCIDNSILIIENCHFQPLFSPTIFLLGRSNISLIDTLFEKIKVKDDGSLIKYYFDEIEAVDFFSDYNAKFVNVSFYEIKSDMNINGMLISFSHANTIVSFQRCTFAKNFARKSYAYK